MEAKGVDVVIFTNSGSTNNHATVHAKYSKYRKPLLKAGVEIFELRPDNSRDNITNQAEGEQTGKDATLHTKAFIIDRERTFIGSMNFDPRSITENTEQGVIFESAAMASHIATWFDNNVETASYRLGLDDKNKLTWQTQKDGKSVTFTKEPNISFGKSLIHSILKILPIENKV